MNKQPKHLGSNGCLECEKEWVYLFLMFVSGYFGGFTYTIRGGVFCNAQTGNLLLLALSLGRGMLSRALYYLLPISAYCLGAFVSEAAEYQLRKLRLVRWETLLVGIEMLVVFFLGALPESVPVQIAQVSINFISAMQFNTFRQTEGVSVSTTFCSNHIRQVGLTLYHSFKRNEEGARYRKRLFVHLAMIGVFATGVVTATVLCDRLLGKGVWFTLIPLGVILADFLYADLKKEKCRFADTPHGY